MQIKTLTFGMVTVRESSWTAGVGVVLLTNAYRMLNFDITLPLSHREVGDLGPVCREAYCDCQLPGHLSERVDNMIP